MRFKMNKFIAATSLIEIMMIFFIIGVVSAAGISLTKPKNEYMKKIAIYAAYRDLATAVASIKDASYVEFSTDLDKCSKLVTVGTNTKICPDKESTLANRATTFPSLSTVLALPKVAFRQTSDNTIQDTIFTSGKSYNYSNLSVGQKKLVKFYQNGLCQRLVAQFNLADMNNNCATSNSASGLLDDSSGYINDFRDKTPSIFLPNGYVYYISKNLYNDFGTNYKRQKIKVESSEYGDDLATIYSHTNTPPNTTTFFNAMYSGLSFYQSGGNASTYIHYPNEVKLALANNAISSSLATAVQKKWITYVQNYYLENKDYFNVYIDINGKMDDSNDVEKGPDMLNEDVFLFHVYRNGTVKPAYDSGFPLNYLTGGVNYLVQKADGKRYKITYAQYAQRPLGYAQCIAGIANDPRYYNQSDGTAYQNQSPHFCDSMRVYDNCYKSGVIDINNPVCSVTVNKPSFFVR